MSTIIVNGEVFDTDHIIPDGWSERTSGNKNPVTHTTYGETTRNTITADDDGQGDVLVGGGGEDRLIAGVGDDVMIGGTLNTTQNQNTLNGKITNDGVSDTFQFNFTFSSGTAATQTFTDLSGSTDGRSGEFQSDYARWLNNLLADAIASGWKDANGEIIVDMEGLKSLGGDVETATLVAGSSKKMNTVEWDFVNSFTHDAGTEARLAYDAGDNSVLDFEWGIDKLELSGLGSMTKEEFDAHFNLVQSGNDLTIGTADGGWSVQLLGAGEISDFGTGESNLDQQFFSWASAPEQDWFS